MLDRFALFTSAISGIYRDIQKIEREEMETYGLKGGYAQYLLAISRHPEGITAARLCEVCDKDKAAVSRVVSELEKKGLLTRECAGGNAYRALLKLTPAGMEAADFVSHRAQLAVEIAGSGLTDANRKIFYETLGQIANNLQAVCENGIPSENQE